MVCSHCTDHVEKALQAIKGVEQVIVDLETLTARVRGTAAVTDLAAAITEAGYAPALLGDDEPTSR